jgi:S-adenosyl-L-methionine hydrolase (adenosine-forming)
MAIISLITDFGTQDEYVGVLKAVILGIDPTAVPVDVSHAVDPQDIAQAAFLLQASYVHFPPGSIHLVVVDPGVGTARDILFLEAGDHRFIAPDNGVLSLVMEDRPLIRLRRIDNPAWRRAAVSPTFHGRDIVAPAAALLSGGADPAGLGPEADPESVVRLNDLKARRTSAGIEGRVVQVDRFGNLITNVDRELLETAMSGCVPEIRVGEETVRGVCRTYSDRAPGEPLALIGSRGALEVAVNCGNAARALRIGKGAPVCVRCP